jgi:hypothetical protein
VTCIWVPKKNREEKQCKGSMSYPTIADPSPLFVTAQRSKNALFFFLHISAGAKTERNTLSEVKYREPQSQTVLVLGQKSPNASLVSPPGLDFCSLFSLFSLLQMRNFGGVRLLSEKHQRDYQHILDEILMMWHRCRDKGRVPCNSSSSLLFLVLSIPLVLRRLL